MQHLFTELITAETEALTILEPFFDILTEFLQDPKSKSFRKFGLIVLGKFVEEHGEQMKENEDLLQLILNAAIFAIRRDSLSDAVYVIDEYASGAPEILAQRSDEVIDLLVNIITGETKKATNWILLQETSLAAFGEMVRNNLAEINVSDESHQQLIAKALELMPATIDPTLNLDIYVFYLKLFEICGGEPYELFARAAIKLLVLPEDEMGESISTSDEINQVKAILKQLMNNHPDVEEICNEICEEQEDRAERLQEAMA